MNFKVKCINTWEEAITAGNIYDVIDGQIIDDDGDARPMCQKEYFKSFKQLDEEGFYGKFELVEEEMKYKVGDKVLIRSDISGCSGINREGKMDKWQGKIMTVKNITFWGSCKMIEDQKENDNCGWSWADEMIERKVEDMFTKDDLKTGMWVEARNGKQAIVLLNTINNDVISGKDLWMPLSCIKNDLTEISSKECDIVKVYQPNSNMDFYCGQSKKLLWERKEEPIIEITPDEIFREFAKLKNTAPDRIRIKKED